MSMNPLMTFDFEDTPVRVVERAGSPWFVATDVATVLGYRDAPNMVRNLDEDEAATHNVSSSSQKRDMTVISESGVYNAIFRSRRPEAVRFRRWVTGEVLPAIRSAGRYDAAGSRGTAQTELSDRVARRRDLPGLLDRLEQERNAEKRRIIHALIQRACAAEQIEPPAIEAIGFARTELRDAVALFFAALEALDAAGENWNHSRNPDRIAVNFPEASALFKTHGYRVPVGRALQQALRADPRFLKTGPVNSRLAGRSRNCWIFKA